MYEFKEGIERSQVPDVCGFIKQNWAVFLILRFSVVDLVYSSELYSTLNKQMMFIPYFFKKDLIFVGNTVGLLICTLIYEN
jgi:hypothetical protein